MDIKADFAYADFFKKTQQLYALLQDELSREIFKVRVDFSATESQSSINRLVAYASKSIQDTLAQYKLAAQKADGIVLYGAGSIGATMLHILHDYKDKLVFCDRNHQHTKTVQGVSVVSPSQLVQNYQNEIVFICAIPGFEEIQNFLREHHIPSKNIFPAVVIDEDTYFDETILLSEGEIFADVGAFEGETTRCFAKKMALLGKTYKKIHLFEPDVQNFQNLKTNLKAEPIKNTCLHDIGLWHKHDTLKFLDNLNVGSTINEKGTCEIKVDSLDNIFENSPVCEYPTYIKMDIEGAELEALKGARGIIAKTRPKLAISVYHKPQDILELMDYLHSIMPDYCFYLRHYTTWKDDTVLYAIV